jgi:hypothetical protein
MWPASDDRLRLFTFCLEITDYSGRVQSFIIKWVKTCFGRHRPILLCNSCGRGAIRLFFRYGTYACRHCYRALYESFRKPLDIRIFVYHVS